MRLLTTRLVATHTTTTRLAIGMLGILSASPALAVIGDADNDALPDTVDPFPCQGDSSSMLALPSENGFMSLYFEDQWPNQGDFDFNDAVVDANVELYRDALGRVKHIRGTFFVKAYGALFDNGLAWALPASRATIGSPTITYKMGNQAAQTIQPISGESDLVIDLTSNIRRDVFGNASNVQINTLEAQNVLQNANQSITVDITFLSPIDITASDAPFDVFLYRSSDYTHQIHRPRYSGTTRMNATLRGTADDGSAGGRFFVDRGGIPFVLEIPNASSLFPKEGARIDALFPRIVGFGQSGGSQNADFFQNSVATVHGFQRGFNNSTLPTAPSIGQLASLRSNSCIVVTGADGAFRPTSNTTLTAREYDFTTFEIPAGVTVTVVGSNPLKIRARNGIQIDGILDASGQNGEEGLSAAQSAQRGRPAKGGAGGGGGGANGGDGGVGSGVNANAGGGLGGGLGALGTVTNNPASVGHFFPSVGASGGGGGYATVGATGSNGFCPLSRCPAFGEVPIFGAAGGAAYGDAALTTLFGGSGGGGGVRGVADDGDGAGGGGGGGIIVLAAPTITVSSSGVVRSNGGNGGNLTDGSDGGPGGGGSGGTLYFHAPSVVLQGAVRALGGAGGTAAVGATPGLPGAGGNGSNGRVRIDVGSGQLVGNSSPAAFVVNINAVSVIP